MPAPTAPHSDLGWYIQAFFQKFPTLASRPAHRVFAGAYVEGGQAVTRFGTQRTPRFTLRVGRTPVAGQDVSGVTLGGTSSVDVPLLELEQRADAVSDDQASIAEILRAYGDEAASWATAISGASGRQAAFGRQLREVNQVPQGAPNDQLGVLKALLRRHFSYSDVGAYVPKWSGQGRSFPGDVSDAYRQAFLVERVLDRGQFYCFTVLGSGGGRATEAIARLTRVDDELRVRVLATAQRDATQAVSDFCFFYAHEGTNVEVPASARGAFTPEFAALLFDGDPQAALQRARSADDWIVENDAIKVSLLMTPDADTSSLPQGVILLPEEALPSNVEGDQDPEGERDAVADALQDDIRVALVPAERLVELASNDAVQAMYQQRMTRPYLDQALPRIKHAELLADLNAQGGEGVVVGIVDSGIDGNHPAFAGRIEKVWDQNLPTNNAFPHPSGRGNDFGQVFDTQAEIQANSIDDNGHGTHVAGIAAGAASGAYTLNGAAPKAKIIFVRTSFQPDHVRRGVEWIMREAGDRPCVINLSLGIDWAGHDGVDDFALLIRRTVRRPRRGGGHTWVPKRTICVAAGNARIGRYHAQIDALAPGATAAMDLNIARWTDPAGNPILLNGARFELYARPTPANVHGGVRLSVRVRFNGVAGPASTKWFPFDPTGQVDQDPLGLDTVQVVNGPPPAGDHRGLVFSRHQLIRMLLMNAGGLTFGSYAIEVRNDGAHEVEVHAYRTNANNQHPSGAHPVFFPNGTERSQIGSPAVAYGLIPVGATVNRLNWPTLAGGTQDNDRMVLDPATNLPTGTVTNTIDMHAHFSSTGPIRGSQRNVIIAAPGSGIFSARSQHPNAYPAAGYGPNFVAEHAQDALTIEMSGTSMASPMVAGCCACIYEKHPGLNASEMARRLQRSPRQPAGWVADADGPGILNGDAIVT
jgi:subtilisin family serine protease